MTNNIRVFLWAALGATLFFNWTQWQRDYAPPPAPTAQAATANGGAGATPAPSFADSVPKPAQSTPSGATTPTAPDAGAAVPANTAAATNDKTIRVTTDVLILEISLVGGTLVHAELPGYPLVKGEPAPVVLLNRDQATTNYILQTGFSAVAGTDAPSHLAQFTASADSYSLTPGQQELRVPLTWTDGKGVTVTKTFVFHRSMFSIGLEYRVNNAGAAAWQAASYARISRTDPAVERSMFKVESFATRGPVVWAPKPDKEGAQNIYRKLALDKPNDHLPVIVKDGWIGAMQHHFVSAFVPDPQKPYNFELKSQDRSFQLSAAGPVEIVAPGTAKTFTENLFVGPKLQKQLATLHPELDRVADYTWLTAVAKPLFWLLDVAHSVVKNWGLSIIFVTFLLKLLFYPLSEKSGRSIARMRTLAPRLKTLQETYKDDRAKLGQATMDLYRSEKVNPLSGCLPMVIQMPVFLAFYWVLLESVEMRQAPFFGWINDLSSRDPFFILPALNGLAMWFQYKLNPPPADPVQAKVFQFMPIIFSVMFALFPAGLVLYWVTNTGLSILQQWNINRKLAAEDKLRKS